jgi:hypothetical protein
MDGRRWEGWMGGAEAPGRWTRCVCVCVWDDGVVGAESGSRLGMGTGGFEDTMPVKKMIWGSSRLGISLLGFSSILGVKDQQCCLMAGLAC